jgi:hypothetical protein
MVDDYELQFDLACDAGFDYAPHQLHASKINPPTYNPSTFLQTPTIDLRS